MPLDIDRQHLILIILLARALRQVHIYHPLPQRALHIEPQAQVLCAPLICLRGAVQEAIARISRPGILTVRGDLGTGAEKLLTSGIGADECGGAVEVCSFGGGGEDVGEEEEGDAALRDVNFSSMLWYSRIRCGVKNGRTVARTPTTTTMRLKLCCVVRTTFSPGDRSDQRTRPVSPVRVMDLRDGCGGGGGGGGGGLDVVWAARTCCEVENGWRLRAGEGAVMGALRHGLGGMRGSAKDGRSSAMASDGL